MRKPKANPLPLYQKADMPSQLQTPKKKGKPGLGYPSHKPYTYAMESIFDYNPTDEEWRALFGQCPADDPEFFAEVEQDVKDAGGSPLSTLIRLFILRGETKKAREYLARIEDPLEHYEASTFFQHMS